MKWWNWVGIAMIGIPAVAVFINLIHEAAVNHGYGVYMIVSWMIAAMALSVWRNDS